MDLITRDEDHARLQLQLSQLAFEVARAARGLHAGGRRADGLRRLPSSRSRRRRAAATNIDIRRWSPRLLPASRVEVQVVEQVAAQVVRRPNRRSSARRSRTSARRSPTQAASAREGGGAGVATLEGRRRRMRLRAQLRSSRRTRRCSARALDELEARAPCARDRRQDADSRRDRGYDRRAPTRHLLVDQSKLSTDGTSPVGLQHGERRGGRSRAAARACASLGAATGVAEIGRGGVRAC